MPWRGFEALPPYFGGKRRLAPLILREISQVYDWKDWNHLGLCDPFLGGGAISLYAKAQGFRVTCGDVAERCALIGRAVIENNSVRLTDADLDRLFVEAPAEAHEQRDETLPLFSTFRSDKAAFLNNAFTIANAVEEPTKRALLRLLLLKYIFWLRPHSKFSSPGAFDRPFAEGRLDDIKDTYKHAIAANAAPPLHGLRRMQTYINHAVMQGAQPCRALKADAAETIRATQDAEVLYLDPPYSGTLSYEKEYRMLDRILGDGDLETSGFSAPDGLRLLGELLTECDAFPLWVISYGNQVSGLDEVVGIVQRHREAARTIEIQYRHLEAVASAEKSAANREFIILAGKD